MLSAVLSQPTLWVKDVEMLNELCLRWSSRASLALDTEFIRTQTYFPVPALLQVNDGTTSYLIDPLWFQDLSPLARVLADPAVTKFMHSCSEDMDVLHHLLGQMPVNVFDTQIAAAMLGLGFSVGYANLVGRVLDVQLPKEETRSDWLQRPLSEAQVCYAAMDVEYLWIVGQQFRDQLVQLGRLAWLEEECGRIAPQVKANQEPSQAYLRVKSAWKLPPLELAVLMVLAEWRELTAQQRNLPRNRVLLESAMLTIAERKPTHVAQLRQIEGLNDRTLRIDGATLVQIVRQVLDDQGGNLPDPIPRPLSGSQNSLIKTLRPLVEKVADELGVAPELLARKKDYEAFIRLNENRGAAAVRLPESLVGWRETIVGNLFREHV